MAGHLHDLQPATGCVGSALGFRLEVEKAYTELGYDLIELPRTSPEERVEFLLDNV